MANAGQVRVHLTREEMRTLARWLQLEYAPGHQEGASAAAAISRRLRASAERKGRDRSVQLLFRRQDARWFAGLSTCLYLAGDPEGVISVPREVKLVGRSFALAMRGRGRPATSREDREARARKSFAVCERQRWRVRKLISREKAWDAWLAAGNTILGGDEPPPSI